MEKTDYGKWDKSSFFTGAVGGESESGTGGCSSAVGVSDKYRLNNKRWDLWIQSRIVRSQPTVDSHLTVFTTSLVIWGMIILSYKV